MKNFLNHWRLLWWWLGPILIKKGNWMNGIPMGGGRCDENTITGSKACQSFETKNFRFLIWIMWLTETSKGRGNVGIKQMSEIRQKTRDRCEHYGDEIWRKPRAYGKNRWNRNMIVKNGVNLLQFPVNGAMNGTSGMKTKSQRRRTGTPTERTDRVIRCFRLSSDVYTDDFLLNVMSSIDEWNNDSNGITMWDKYQDKTSKILPQSLETITVIQIWRG